MRKKNCPVTWGLIGICVLVYIYTSIRYSFSMNAMQGIEAGAYIPLLITTRHEYYRLITANFIHFGISHILLNMLSLYNVGPFIERIYGRNRYLLLIAGSALGTTGIPYLFTLITNSNPMVVSGGASGIILGLLGGLCYLSLRYKGLYKAAFSSVVPSLVMIALISVIVPSVSLSGHLGGFAGGLITTFLIDRFYHHPAWYAPRYYMN